MCIFTADVLTVAWTRAAMATSAHKARRNAPNSLRLILTAASWKKINHLTFMKMQKQYRLRCDATAMYTSKKDYTMYPYIYSATRVNETQPGRKK